MGFSSAYLPMIHSRQIQNMGSCTHNQGGAGMSEKHMGSDVPAWCHARSVSKGVILQNSHTLHVSEAEAQRAD